MVAISSKEVKSAAALLEEGGDSPAELAKAVIEAVDEIRAGRVRYIAVIQWRDDPPVYTGYGPYPTMRKAVEDIEKGRIAPIPVLARAVVPVYSLQHVSQQWENTDKREDIAATGQWALIADDAANMPKRKKR